MRKSLGITLHGTDSHREDYDQISIDWDSSHKDSIRIGLGGKTISITRADFNSEVGDFLMALTTLSSRDDD